MERAAIELAKSRLHKAEKSLEALKAASSYEEAKFRVRQTLIAPAAIYEKLEQGAKLKGKSQGWFGRRKYAKTIRSSLLGPCAKFRGRQLGASSRKRETNMDMGDA